MAKDPAARRAILPGGLGRFGLLWPVVAALRVVWWTFQAFDSLIEAGLKRLIGTRYERTGTCLQTGVCCEIISMEPPRFFRRHPPLLSLLMRLGEIVYPFRLHAQAGEGFLYTCENFDRERRLCRNYRFRPKVCRDYPLVGFFSRPYFYKGCGFGIRVRRQRGSFVEILDLKRRDTSEGPPPPSERE